MKILIINPPFYRLQGSSLMHYPPGCCYVAAALEKAGFNPLILNADYDPDKKTILGNTDHINIGSLMNQSDEYHRRLNNDNDPIWKEIRGYIARFKPNVLIISVFSTTLDAGNKIAKIAKSLNPNIKTIFEGWTNRGLHSAVDPSLNGILEMDFAIRREPDHTAAELAKALASDSSDFSHILGLSWRRSDGTIVHNKERPFVEDLDSLPFPARHCLDGYERMVPHSFQSIYGSRGCPFNCIFCGCHISMGYKPRFRSAKNMVDEIDMVHRKYGTKYFYICDDIFFFYKDRARQFCHILLERKIPVYWSAQTRAEMVDNELLGLMKKSGGQHVAVGVEVGNPEIRNLLRKDNTVDDVRKCAKLVKKNGLYMVAFCIIGLPWEGTKEIEDTVSLVKEIKPYIVYPYIPLPAQGTELANVMLQKNQIKPAERKKVLEWAFNEFAKINRRNLLKDILKRPRFYLALAQDMKFLKHPSYLFGYLKDYFIGTLIR